MSNVASVSASRYYDVYWILDEYVVVTLFSSALSLRSEIFISQERV